MRSHLVALFALTTLATVILCKPTGASPAAPTLAATPAPVEDPVFDPPSPIKKCTGCLFNDSALGTTSTTIKPGCSVSIRMRRFDFDNDDCTDKKSGPGCPDSVCKFKWKVEAKHGSSGCSGVTWSISGGDQGVSDLTSSYQLLYEDDQSQGQDCGTIVDRLGTITGEWTDSNGDEHENAATWNAGVGCTTCTESQE